MRMLDAARELTLDVIVRVMFGIDDPAEVKRFGEPFDELLALAISQETPVRYALRKAGALRTWGRLAAINRRIDEIVFGLIAEHRADPRPAGGILSMLVDARTEDGEGLSDKEIRADLITLVLAGHETTATTLAWLIDLLLHHPQALERVRAEAHSGATTYTEAVINETLRLRPPAPITGRMTAGRFQLGDYTLEPGTRIVLLLDVINRDPETYPDPHEFRPERFVGARPQPTPGSRSAGVSSGVSAPVSRCANWSPCCTPSCGRVGWSRSVPGWKALPWGRRRSWYRATAPGCTSLRRPAASPWCAGRTPTVSPRGAPRRRRARRRAPVVPSWTARPVSQRRGRIRLVSAAARRPGIEAVGSIRTAVT